MSDYAQISVGVVINTIMANSSDFFDPNFVWVDITNMNPQPGIGWNYNQGIFTPEPHPPADWTGILNDDVNNIHIMYLQALADYASATTSGNKSKADQGIQSGVQGASLSYSMNEQIPFTTFINLISTGG